MTRTLATIYDAGVLVAADRSDRATWAEHHVRLSAGIVPLVPANVVAQASRSSRQVQLRRFLRGCEVVAFDERSAHRAGTLLAKSGTADVVDASVVALAASVTGEILTTDVLDIERLASATGRRLTVSRR